MHNFTYCCLHAVELFAISHKEAQELNRIAEDKVFLEDQRGPRQMKIAGTRTWLSRKTEHGNVR